nr:glycosyltransferase [Bacteroidales bacterium]
MKVIFFTQSALGGAERMSILYAKILSKEHEVILHSFGSLNVLEPFCENKFVLRFHKGNSALDGFLSSVRRIVKSEKPDVIFCSLMPLNWRVALATFGLKTRIIFRSDNYIETQSLLSKIRLAIAYRKAKYIIAQTEEMRIGIIDKLFIKASKVVTIQNPLDKEYIDNKLKEKSPYPNNVYIKYLAVGRITSEKGFDLLIEAFSNVLKHNPNSELYIVGDTNYNSVYYKSLLRLIDEKRLRNVVHFVGLTDNPYTYMKYADVFVLSSRIEGLPNVLIEALYCGTPSAAFKCIPVIERIVEEGKTGYLATKENIKELSEAMIRASELKKIQTSYDFETESFIIKLFTNLNQEL